MLVGHYLGVDHAGHTDDVFAPSMAAKLAQMDAQLAQVCRLVRSGSAYPGGTSGQPVRIAFLPIKASGVGAAHLTLCSSCLRAGLREFSSGTCSLILRVSCKRWSSM